MSVKGKQFALSVGRAAGSPGRACDNRIADSDAKCALSGALPLPAL